MQDSCSLSQLIFPINISLCAEEQAAVQLMIWITAACRPAIPAACWEPNSLRVLRSVTHAPAPPPSPHRPSSVVIRWKTHCALMADAWHLPLSASHLSPHSSALWLPLLPDFFNTPLRLLARPLLRHALPAPPPLTKDRRRLIYNQGGNALPHHPPPPTPPPSVMVWTLMKKRWVLSCAPIYLSGQGTCTLMPTSVHLSLSRISTVREYRILFKDR